MTVKYKLFVCTYRRKENVNSEKQRMDQNYDAMRCLASVLNTHCPQFCKVMLMDMDLLCFNLSVLAEYTHKVYPYNIIGVTGHHGLKALPIISEVPIHLSCRSPAVALNPYSMPLRKAEIETRPNCGGEKLTAKISYNM